MQLTLLKSKIHRATITESNLNYEGSITIGSDIMKQAHIVPFEKVQVANINNGARFTTYVIEGKAGTGEICLNGAAARLGQIGDKIIILSYVILPEQSVKNYRPSLILMDEKNQIKSISK